MNTSFYHHLAAAKLDMMLGHIIGVKITYDAENRRQIEVLHPELGNICYYSEADDDFAHAAKSANDTDWGWSSDLTANANQVER